jgi:hypothetical protein
LLFLRLLQHAVVTPPTRYRPSRSRTQSTSQRDLKFAPAGRLSDDLVV